MLTIFGGTANARFCDRVSRRNFIRIGALAGRPEHISRFLGVIAGSVGVADFYSPANIDAMMASAAAAA